MLRHKLQQSEHSTGTEKKTYRFVSCSGDVTYCVKKSVIFRKQEVTLCPDKLWRQPGDPDF